MLESSFDQLVILGYVALAMILGAIIGFEREMEDKPAGLRTHMLVAGASALFVSMGDVMIEHFSRDLPGKVVQSDPIRLLQAVVTGVSFLGAGTIMREQSHNRVQGLTTAASVLFASAIGAVIPLEQFVLAIGATFFVLVTLRLLGYVEDKFQEKLDDN